MSSSAAFAAPRGEGHLDVSLASRTACRRTTARAVSSRAPDQPLIAPGGRATSRPADPITFMPSTSQRPTRTIRSRRARHGGRQRDADSFSDGGEFLDARRRRALPRAAGQGADILDIGGESTRPGRSRSPPRRSSAGSCPWSRALADDGRAISIDTTKAEVAAARARGRRVDRQRRVRLPLRPGAGRRSSPRPACDCCLMHMLGEPRTMQEDPRYDDVVVRRQGVPRGAARVRDVGGRAPRSASGSTPASASARRVEHNLELLRRLDEIVAIGRPVVVGTSRKSFLGKLTGPRRRRSGCPARSPRTCSRSSAARGSSACTTWPRSRMR